MSDPLTVETNWIIDVVLRRDAGSEELWGLAEAGNLDLIVPAMCLAEAIKALEATLGTWRELEQLLQRDVGDMARARDLSDDLEGIRTARTTMANRQQRMKQVFWPALERIAGGCQLVPLDGGIIRRAGEITEALTLTPADAAVLATVEAAATRGLCSHFMSRDWRAFDRPGVRAYLARNGITYWRDPQSFLRHGRGGPAT